MKKILFLIISLSVIFSTTSEKTFKIDGMTCGGCANKVKTAVNTLDGVESCLVNVDKGQAKITFDDEKINEDKILSTLKDKTDFSCSIPKKEAKKGFFQWLFGL